LNDVEAGGGTRFSLLNHTVEAKRGRVLLWPSVLDSDPNKKDGRTDHEALPVEAGVKYAGKFASHGTYAVLLLVSAVRYTNSFDRFPS